MDFSSLALQIGNQQIGGQKAEAANIIEFVESGWGLRQKLYPVQRIILKAHYGIALDDNPEDFDLEEPIPKDHPEYEKWAHLTGNEKGYYKYRVTVTDFRRQNTRYMTEAEYLRWIHSEGRCNISEVVPGHQRKEMVLAIGRRSGKTHIAACIAAYETYKLIHKQDPQAYYGLPIGEVIGIISVATDKEQAGVLYSKVSGYYKECPYFNPYTANNTMSYARFQTPKDIERYGQYALDDKANATIRVTFRPCRASGLRGPGNIVVILDEMAHFTKTGQSSASKVYDSVTPSTSAFSPKDPSDPSTPIGDVEGRIIAISSPHGKQGQFYKLFKLGFASGDVSQNILSVQAPTWEVNPTVPASEFTKHYLKSANVFYTEYGAQFTDRSAGWIENEDDLLACVDENLRPVETGISRKAHFMGIDFALAGDGTAIAIGHVDSEQRVVLDLVDWIKPGRGDYKDVERLDFDEVADWIQSFTKRFTIQAGIFDQWSGIVFEQALKKRGLNQFKSQHYTKQMSSDIYRNFKDLMFDKRLVLYDWPLTPKRVHCGYIRELLQLQADHESKTVITVSAPRMPGQHDDRSDAIMRMVWLAAENMGSASHIASRGTSKITKGRRVGNPRNLFRPGGSSPDRQRSPNSSFRTRGR